MKLYCAGWDRIELVDVDRYNDKSVWIKGRRRPRMSSYESFFERWDDAQTYLINLRQADYESAQKQLDYVLGRLSKVKALCKELV